ncbi:hypothetical protein HHI36_004650, partial [Cryptolaemus montrouzieri]
IEFFLRQIYQRSSNVHTAQNAFSKRFVEPRRQVALPVAENVSRKRSPIKRILLEQ